MYFPTSKNAVDVPSNLFAFRPKLAHHSSLAPIPLKQCIESNATHTHISCKTKKKKKAFVLWYKLTVAPATPWGPGSPSRPRAPCQRTILV